MPGLKLFRIVTKPHTLGHCINFGQGSKIGVETVKRHLTFEEASKFISDARDDRIDNKTCWECGGYVGTTPDPFCFEIEWGNGRED